MNHVIISFNIATKCFSRSYIIRVDNHHSVLCVQSTPYSQKYWQELNLAVESIAKFTNIDNHIPAILYCGIIKALVK